ncbi:MAG: TIGR04282 family arsenosugar biosynthesis glycosyltransferase [Endozoicomonadaceae bacterium]|nr:TIGR04282 family arsenosugar biosynthesis glycosyltransferase [Endozoicomonadaceae bacterium]
MYSYPDAAILLFAKPLIAGQVKTRLIPAIGAESACFVHESLLTRVGEQLMNWRLAPVQLWTGMAGLFPALFDSWCHRAQCEGDLGQRMAYSASKVLQEGCQYIVLLGSDCPVLTRAYLEAALKGLQYSDVVLGPAEDGGYVLLAMRREIPVLFQTIDWGSDQVLAQTQHQLKEAQISWLELDTLWDVDRPEDLARYRALMVTDNDKTSGLGG